RKHFAIVIDEYGGMSGIITMNDLLEQLVGDFDEIDDEELEPYLKQINDNRWRVNGLVTVKDIIEQLKVKLPEDGEYDTFGGLVFDVLKAIPEDGSQLELKIGKMDISIKKIKDHRIMDAYITVNKEIDSDEND
ncbi:MAG: transporter associated domain-containing protein, partial [Erysipelotrichaceae bacterium]|nr:transporter associated domain-containing protein [Erysipelotrichaceae bacterium]